MIFVCVNKCTSCSILLSFYFSFRIELYVLGSAIISRTKSSHTFLPLSTMIRGVVNMTSGGIAYNGGIKLYIYPE